MTMLDDDRLVSLLANAGAAFEVPATGPDDILALALGPAAADERVHDAGGAGDAAGTTAGETDEAAAPRGADGARETRRVVAVARRHRVLSVAACLVVVLLAAGTVGALASGPSTRPRLSTTAPPPRHGAAANAPVTTTTGPALEHNSATPSQGLAAAPFAPTNPPGAGTTTGATPSTTPGATAVPKGAVGQPAKIEQTGTLGLTVGHGELGRAMTRLTGLAGAYGGFVANSQTQSGADAGGAPNGTVTLQVPVDNFATVLKAAQAVGKTSSLTTKANDVTGQYVDLQARVAALEASRQQYLTIMTKATTVGDVLAVQSQLDTIQFQIEQLQGQLNVLGSETSYSTLTVNVSESTLPARPGPVPASGFIQAWHDSIGGFVAGVDGALRVAGPLLFALLCLAVVLVGGRVLWRRFQRHRL